MRIAFVSDAYVPVPTGTAVSVEILKRTLEKMGHTVYVFAPEYKGWKDQSSYVIRLPGMFRKSPEYAPWVWPTTSVNREKVKKLRLDVVHSHYFFDLFPFAIRLARAIDVPLVHTFYKIFPEFARNNPPLLTSRQRAAEKSIVKTCDFAQNCDQIIALSTASKKYYMDLSISTPIKILPVGIFVRDFSSLPAETIKAKYKIPLKRKLLLFVGRVDENDNIKFLLHSFKKVWKAIDDVHLMIVGGGERLKDFRRAISDQPYHKYVTLTGIMTKSQVNRIFGAADIFVYPAQLDPQPLVILESLASGTPVVAVKGFGAQDFIEKNQDGLISDFTVDDFSDKIIELLRRDKMRLDFSMKARLGASKFKTSNLTADLLDLYHETIENYSNKLTK